MIDLYRMYSRTVEFYQRRYEGSQWSEIRSTMRRRGLTNLVVTLFLLLLAALWHYRIEPVQIASVGILLVGLGAGRLALVSARSHVRKFDDSAKHTQGLQEQLTAEYRPRVAGNMVDAVSGFALVVIGFTIRIGAEFL